MRYEGPPETSAFAAIAVQIATDIANRCLEVTAANNLTPPAFYEFMRLIVYAAENMITATYPEREPTPDSAS